MKQPLATLPIDRENAWWKGELMPITVLGPIGLLDRDGEPIVDLSDRQRRLVAALTVEAGAPVPGDRLVHRVWGDDELPAGGVRALHTRLSRVRPHLRAAGVKVETHGHSYRLDADGALDATRFEELVEAGRSALGSGDSSAAVTHLERALALWAGNAYEGVADLEWAQPEVTRLEELRSAARELRFEALLVQGRHTQIVPAVEEAIGAAPWRDRLRLQLAVALYRSGRQAEALRGIARYRNQLVEELGLEPGPDIRRLEELILTQDPELDVTPPGTRSVSGYQFRDVVGEGAFAVVWRAIQPALDRQVAIKQIRSPLANRPEFIRRFEAEAQLVASLEHPHIVPLHDFWREPDGAFLVMRWLGGGTLASRLLHGPMPAPAIGQLIEQVGGALRTAHRSGVIHRDVKSSNILFDDDDHAFLGDFGIALGAGDDDAFVQAVSTGSPAYASPEQLRREELDERSDLYALGIVVFEAATGRLPFVATSQADLVRSQLEDPVPTPSDVEPAVPEWIDEVVARCCAKDRRNRFADIDELMAVVPRAVDSRVPGPGTASPEHTRSPDGPNPYKGLRSFLESDVSDFRGRERLVDRFLEVLSRPGVAGRLLVAVGASGSGKSSAVRAGLIPALRRGELPGSAQWSITTMIPGAHPFEELEAALSRVATVPRTSLLEVMRSDQRGIARALRLAAPDRDTGTLLVIDQFEELFTLARPERASAFIDALTTALAEPRAELRVIATIRADFWDRPLHHPVLASMLEDAAVTVGPMMSDELERAITEPARQQGVEFAPGLVARLIAEVADQPGALPLLQYTLTALFELEDRGVIPIAAYDAFGGLDGALEAHAEQVHAAATDDVRLGLRRSLGDLVTLGEGVPDTRRRVRLADVAIDEPTRGAVEQLGDARLLTFDHDPITREPTVEIAHEALLSAWPRLRGWIDEDRDELRTRHRLAAAAQDWEAHDRDDDLLYRGARLDDALELQDRSDHPIGSSDRAFVEASRDGAEAEVRRSRRRSRVQRGLLVLTVLLLVVAIGAGFVAVGQRDDARAARIASEVDRMAAAAPTLAGSDPRLALLIAAEAHARGDSAATLGSLQRTMLATGPILGYVGDPDRQYRAARWIDQTTIAAAHLGGVEVYDLQTGARTFEHSVPLSETRGLRSGTAGGTVAFDVDADGVLAAVGTTTDDVEVINLSTGDTRRIDHDAQVTALAFDPDVDRLATGDIDGVVRLFDPGSGELLRTFDAHPEQAEEIQALVAPLGMFDSNAQAGMDGILHGGVHTMAFLPDGSLLTATTPVIRRWDVDTGSQIGADAFPPGDVSQFPPPNPPVLITTLIDDVHVDPRDPTRVAVASRNYLQQFGLDDAVQTSQVWLPTDRSDSNTTIAGSAFTDDGRWTIWLSDGRLRLLDEAGRVHHTSQPAIRTPASLELDPTGQRVAGAGDGGLFVASLTGGSLLADGIRRSLPSDHATITDDGSMIAENVFAAGPSRFLRRSGPGWIPADVPAEITDHAAVVPFELAGESVVEVFRSVGEPAAMTEEAVNETLESSWREVETGDVRLAVRGPRFARAVSPDGRLMAIDLGLDIHVFDMDAASQLVELDDLATQDPPLGAVLGGTAVRSIDFSADADRLVATAQDGRLAIWNTGTWDPIDVPEHVGPAAVASFSPNGSFFATAGSDGRITLHDNSFEVVRVMRGIGAIDSTGEGLEWSADGRHLLTLVDGVPRMWDLERGEQLGAPFPLSIGSRPGAASGDELQLVTIDGDALNVWNLDTETWAPIACRAAGRNLTAQEWESFGPAGEPYRSTCPQFPPGA